MTSATASTMPGARRGVLLGDWGHFGEVLAEIDASGGALSLVGSATDEASASVLLRDARPDFAIVSARPGRIPGLVALAARSGCHVVSEKPLALRLRSGALATATLDYLRPESPVPHGDDGLRVAGERGELTVDIDRGRAVLLESGAAPRELPLPAPEPFYAPWLLALPPRGVPAPPDDRTLRAFRLSSEALAAREAADSGRPVRLPFPETFW